MGSRTQSRIEPTAVNMKAGIVTHSINVGGGSFRSGAKARLPMKKETPMQVSAPICGLRVVTPRLRLTPHRRRIGGTKAAARK